LQQQKDHAKAPLAGAFFFLTNFPQEIGGMATAFLPNSARSLAAIDTGEAVEIRRILFDVLRGLCADLGVQEGDVVRCRANTSSHLLLETPTGRTVALERDWARFVQVDSATSQANRVGSGKEVIAGYG
jgi:hypothetical protein